MTDAAETTWTPRKTLDGLLPESVPGMPNLDAWEYEDLRDLEHHLKTVPRLKMALRLDAILGPPARFGSVEIITPLQLYAANAAKGRRSRLMGEVDQALRFEARADAAYSDLPAWARW